MGSKRCYDGEEHMQLPYKCQKQFATNEKLNSFDDERLTPIASIPPYNQTNDKHNIPDGYIGCKGLQVGDSFEVNNIRRAQAVVDKGFEDGFYFPWITNCLDGGRSGKTDIHSSLAPEYFESSFPRRESIHVDVDYPLLSFLDRYPRKQVPVGVNHQAELPKLLSSADRVFIRGEEEKWMGRCIIPMPCSSHPTLVRREDCDCVERGSVRCVRQHVTEARDKLVNAVGEDKFRDLGFMDMGEEVALRWSQEEEHVFHEIVFSNPASLGKDFWSCLSEEFPTRSMHDIVSYYFNVFMLRKRAAQNRSQILDIDSDDDEWHPGHGSSCVGEDGDSLVAHDEDNESEEDNSDGGQDTPISDDKDKTHQPNTGFPHENKKSIPGNLDDSCVSYEFQSEVSNSAGSETGIATVEISGPKHEKYFSSCNSNLSHGCDFSVNFRQWDEGFPAGLDFLLPTENMIEEMFGPGSLDNKPGPN